MKLTRLKNSASVFLLYKIFLLKASIGESATSPWPFEIITYRSAFSHFPVRQETPRVLSGRVTALGFKENVVITITVKQIDPCGLGYLRGICTERLAAKWQLCRDHEITMKF